MIIAIIFFLFLILLLLPFLPGILELSKKKDAEPLFIAMDYIRNPRYFSKSFKEMLIPALEKTNGETGFHNIELSKNESIEICPSTEIPDEKEIHHLLYIQGDLVSGNRVYLGKEAYVTQNAVLGQNNVIQAMVAEGQISLGRETKIRRWLDAEGDIHVGERCNLGINISSGGKIFLGKNSVFRRVFAIPVITGDREIPDPFEPPVSIEQSKPTKPGFIRRKAQTVPKGTILQNNVIFTRKVTIGANTLIHGDVKGYDEIVLEENVTINGNIFADASVFIGPNARISGNIFSQQSVHISHGAIISGPSNIKSVIGKKEVQIEPSVIIYGFISTEGSGIVL
jgi:predicted acyltransferase (DUF342 family)